MPDNKNDGQTNNNSAAAMEPRAGANAYSTVIPIVPPDIPEKKTARSKIIPSSIRRGGTEKTDTKKTPQNIHDGHRDRMREKYLKSEIDAFADHELVELLLFYCVPRGNVNPLAHKLINEYGSLHGLLDAPPEDIARRCKVNIKTAILMSLIPRIFKRYETGKWDKRTPINTSAKAAALLYSLFANEQNECMYMLCLDNQQNLIRPVLISSGTINETIVYPRVVVQTALKYNAAHVILAHNHPSGVLMPSQGDIATTKTIMNALAPINVLLIDHLIIAGKNYYSFSEKKLMGLVYDV